MLTQQTQNTATTLRVRETARDQEKERKRVDFLKEAVNTDGYMAVSPCKKRRRVEKKEGEHLICLLCPRHIWASLTPSWSFENDLL